MIIRTVQKKSRKKICSILHPESLNENFFIANEQLFIQDVFIIKVSIAQWMTTDEASPQWITNTSRNIIF